MLLAQYATPQLQHSDRERLGLRILAFGIVEQRQVAHCFQRVRMLLAQHATLHFQSLGEQRFGLRILAFVPVEYCQVAHCLERAGMLPAKHAALLFQCPGVQRLGLCILAFGIVQRRQIVHRIEQVAILFAQNSTPQVEGTFQLLLGLRILAQLPVRIAHGLPDRSLHQRLCGELASDTRRSPIQSGSHLKVRIGLRFGTSLAVGARLSQQVLLQKIVYCFRGSRFGRGNLLRAPGASRFPGAGDYSRNQHDENGRHARHHGLVATGELL